MNYGFSVGMGAKSVALGNKKGAQLRKVVNFPIEDDPYGAVFIRHRLCARANIDNAQPPVSQSQPGFEVISFIIRTSVHERAVHPFYGLPPNSARRITLKDSANTAHLP